MRIRSVSQVELYDKILFFENKRLRWIFSKKINAVLIFLDNNENSGVKLFGNIFKKKKILTKFFCQENLGQLHSTVLVENTRNFTFSESFFKIGTFWRHTHKGPQSRLNEKLTPLSGFWVSHFLTYDFDTIEAWELGRYLESNIR